MSKRTILKQQELFTYKFDDYPVNAHCKWPLVVGNTSEIIIM